MGYVRNKTGIDLTGDNSLLGKTLDATGNLVEKVGDTVAAIASDPKKLAMVGLAVAFPAAATTIGQSLGLSGAAASAVGQTLINTAINGGDLEQAVKATALTYVGAEAAGQIADAAIKSGTSEVIAKTLGQAGGQAVTAAAMGKDPLLALVAGGANVAAGVITQDIPGFAELPAAAQNAVKSAISAGMQDKDAIGAAASALVNEAVGYAKNATKVQVDLASKGLALLDENALAAIKDADATDLTNVIRAAETAEKYGRTLDAEAITNIAQADSPAAYDEAVTRNIVNPAKAELAGFDDVFSWEQAQVAGISSPQVWAQYKDTADMYQQVFGVAGDIDSIKKYMPHTPTTDDVTGAMQVYLNKRPATEDELLRYDFDGNGKIDLADTLNLTKYSLGKPTSVPPGQYWSENSGEKDVLAAMQEDYPKVMAERAGFGDDIDTWKVAAALGLDKKGYEGYQSVSDLYADVFGSPATYEQVKEFLPANKITGADVSRATAIYLGKAPATDADKGRYDFDGDGDIDLQDTLNLLKYSLGKPTTAQPSDYWAKAGDLDLDETRTKIQAAYDALHPPIKDESNVADTQTGLVQDVVQDDGTTADIQEVVDQLPVQDTQEGGQDLTDIIQDDGTTEGVQEVIDQLPDQGGTETEIDTSCADGFHWDADLQMCVADTDETKVSTDCPDGYVYNVVTQACEPITSDGTGGTGGTGGTQGTTNTQTQQTQQQPSGMGLAALLALMGSGQQQTQPMQPQVADTSGMVDIETLLANPLQTDYRKLANKPKMAEGGSIDDLLALLNQKG